MTAAERIYNLLGPLVDGRCYPLFIPEGEDVAGGHIVYNIISTLPDNTLDGITGHEWVDVQIDIYSDDYDDVMQLCHKVIRQLDTITPSDYGGTTYLYDNQALLYRAMVEYGFWQKI